MQQVNFEDKRLHLAKDIDEVKKYPHFYTKSDSRFDDEFEKHDPREESHDYVLRMIDEKKLYLDSGLWILDKTLPEKAGQHCIIAVRLDDGESIDHLPAIWNLCGEAGCPDHQYFTLTVDRPDLGDALTIDQVEGYFPFDRIPC